MHVMKMITSNPEIPIRGPADRRDLQPFVFDSAPVDIDDLPKHSDNRTLSVSFSLWSYEMVVGPIRASSDNLGYSILAVVVWEKLPGLYDFWVLGKKEVGWGFKEQRVAHIIQGMTVYDNLLDLTNTMIRRVHGHHIGAFRGPGRVKRKDHTGAKIIYKPKKVVYVSPERSGESASRVGGHVVHWEGGSSIHPSLTRGAWDRLDDPKAVGLDRQGNEMVRGVTWRSLS